MLAVPRAGGRPRDSALDEAIIQAARVRLVKDGSWRRTIGDIVADAGEAIRTPELLDILRRHAVEPRVALVERRAVAGHRHRELSHLSSKTGSGTG